MSDGVGPALAEPASDTPIPSPARGLSVVFVCQAVDRDDPILAHTVRWIEALARRPRVGRVTVLALRTGRHDLPAAVEVRRFGRSNAFARLVAFYREAVRSLRHRPDLFFICQGGPYPLLLLPFKLLRRVRVVQWKAHPVIGPAMAFYARWCDDLVFTATRASFPLALAKVRVVGHGVDTELFRPADRPRIGDLIAACRIAPRKRVEEMVAAVVRANREFGTRYRLNIYGPTLPGGEAYAAGLERAIDRLGARDWVALHGPVAQDRLPALLNGHRAFLNFSETAVDKAVVEALACGLPVISTNKAVSEIIPADLRPALIVDKGSAEHQARAIHRLLQRPDEEVTALGERMRTLAVRDHSVDRLFGRILEQTTATAPRRPV